MSRRFHLFSLLALLGWIVLGVLFPVWRGTSYQPYDSDHSTTWFKCGTFKLTRSLSPIWAPPVPESTYHHPSLRWPWQAPSRAEHVEISLAFFVFWVTLGLILIGVVARISVACRPPPRPDPLVVISSSLAFGLIIGYVSSYVLMMFTMGAAPGVLYVFPVFLGGGLGLASATNTLEREKKLRRRKVPRVGGDTPTADTSASEQALLPTVASPAGHGNASEMDMPWFALGFLGALLLLFFGLGMASLFRGPLSGVSTLFTPEYERDQTPVNFIIGGVIALVGWSIGLWLYHIRDRRALGAGLITGATVFGVLVGIWH